MTVEHRIVDVDPVQTGGNDPVESWVTTGGWEARSITTRADGKLWVLLVREKR